MQVKATKPGFYKGSLIGVGQSFEVPQGMKASWFTPVSEYRESKPKGKEKAQPETLSEMAKAPTAGPTDLA